MKQTIIIDFTYGESVRFFQLAYSQFSVIRSQTRVKKIGNLREFKLLSAVRKRTDDPIVYHTTEEYFTQEEYKKIHYNLKGRKEDSTIFAKKENKLRSFFISGSIYAPIVTSIGEYKVGYFFDSSNSGRLLPFHQDNFIGTQRHLAGDKIKKMGFKEAIPLMITDKTKIRKTFIQLLQPQGINLSGSMFHRLINIKNKRNVFMYEGSSRINPIFEMFVKNKTGDIVSPYFLEEIHRVKIDNLHNMVHDCQENLKIRIMPIDNLRNLISGIMSDIITIKIRN